jgi:hypothetical protein
MLKISLTNAQLSGIEDAHKSALPVILEHYPDFMESVIVSGVNRDYYTNDVDGDMDDARVLADALDAKKIPYQVLLSAAKPRVLWDVLDDWALMLGE